MIDQFALTPQLFGSGMLTDKAAATALKQVLKNIAATGLLANLDKEGWSRFVEEQMLAELKPDLRDQLNRLLGRIKDLNRLVKHPRASLSNAKEEVDWISVAIEAKARASFRAIVTSSLCEGERGLISLGELLDSEDWDARMWQRQLQTSEDLERVLSDLLGYARRLEIVDPYLRPKPQDRADFVCMCARLLAHRRADRNETSIRLIVAHTAQQDKKYADVDLMLGDWRELLEPLQQQSGMKFCLYVLGQEGTEQRATEQGPRIHNRYLLTDQHGIQAGGSFTAKCKDEWTLLEPRLLASKREEYMKEKIQPYLLRPPMQVSAREAASSQRIR